MKDCCEVGLEVQAHQRRTLQLVLWINAAMFVIEAVAGLRAGSTALLADSGDMLGDAIVYGFSLYAVARGPVWQARAALLKGGIMALFGLGVLTQVILRLVRGGVPSADVMGGIGTLAANTLCLILLWRRRDDDINMRSVWLCSRNDVVANAGVLAAAGAVSLSGSAWPDLLVGLAIASLFGWSAIDVVRRARDELRTPQAV
jgi:Co/Zn/Cd efflux system component